MNYHNEIHDNTSEHDDDSSYMSETSETSAAESVSSIESFSGDLSQLRSVVAAINASIQTLETQLISIQRPIESLHVDQLGDVPFLHSSPFRHTMLKFKSDVGIPGLDTHKRYSFAEILAIVRTYLFESGAVQEDGTICLSKELQKSLGIHESSLSYIELMRHLRDIVH
jgi:hypothetical protein